MIQGTYEGTGRTNNNVVNMDRRITIQSPTTARSATGAETVTWADWGTRWASVDESKTGSDETLLTDQEQAVRRRKFTIRYTSEIQEKWRIVYKGDTYDIMVITELGREKFTQLLAETRK